METIVTRNPIASRPSTLFRTLLAPTPTAPADAAHSAVGPETIAKFLFTSGSTGTPKAVINTQRMWCSNQAMNPAQLAFFADDPPVIVDWSPWHHTAGGNHNFGFVLYNGGTFYIDEGKPAPGAIETTVKNLREVATNWDLTVPKGYEALLPYFRADARLREIFFSRLKVLWFAGAALSQSAFDEMQESRAGNLRRAHHVPDRAGLDRDSPDGAGAHVAEQGFRPIWACRHRGWSRPKLVPSGGKLEARSRGPNIMPGYWRQGQCTSQAFDEDGFYKLGDAVKFEDPADPGAGLLFDGRIAEDFKLATGTWVNVGPLRARLLAHLEPYARDVVIAGADRNEIGVLIFPNVDACRRLVARAALASEASGRHGDPMVRPHSASEDVSGDACVLEEIRTRLNSFAKTSTGSSNRVCRAILLGEPPSLDAGEMTDKGSINQRAVLSRRADLVKQLYAGEPSPRVLMIDT